VRQQIRQGPSAMSAARADAKDLLGHGASNDIVATPVPDLTRKQWGIPVAEGNARRQRSYDRSPRKGCHAPPVVVLTSMHHKQVQLRAVCR